MGRRFFAAVALALVVCGPASAAVAHAKSALDDPLQAQEWWLTAVGADITQAPGPGVPITIVDSGTDPTHPEFAGRPNTTFLNDQTVIGPEEYHGTIVASVAAAPENGVGIVGVYPNAALQLYDASPTPQGIVDLAAVDGILTAAEHCPGVINLSFGGSQPDDSMHEAILTAVRHGCLVVAAAGNSGESGSPVTYPAAWPHVFTVAATDQSGNVASFSTNSPAVDIAAPGVSITGAVPLSRDPSGYQSNLSGTSFSAPIVAAAAAWVWTLRPTLTASQIAGVLRSSAHDIGPPGFDNASGWGLLNIPGALTAAPPAVDPDEPNDDIDEIKPGDLFQAGEPPLTSVQQPNGKISASLDSAEDPIDVYRIWVPAHRTVRVKVTSGGTAAARIWGPKTIAMDEFLAARRRDLRGQSITATKKGFAAYVEVLLTGSSSSARYTLSVKASRH
ncbi:MAG TPA: S8 family serine peptidase [Gaiellaceae bacterium]|nr:S8 family serine peptidase [Gaiellaceae bacterium]